MVQNPKWDLIPSDGIIVEKKKKLFHNPENYKNSSERLVPSSDRLSHREQRIVYNHLINKEDTHTHRVLEKQNMLTVNVIK